MTWSLRLRNGDLATNGARLAKITDEEKMIQDLRIHILQKMGSDKLHPEFGSLLDGGIAPDGTIRPTMIGYDDKEKAKLFIQSELYRIIGDYQRKQLVRAKRDKMAYGKATLTPKEVLFSLKEINIIERNDALNITIGITTGSRTTQVINLTMGN